MKKNRKNILDSVHIILCRFKSKAVKSHAQTITEQETIIINSMIELREAYDQIGRLNGLLLRAIKEINTATYDLNLALAELNNTISGLKPEMDDNDTMIV